MLKELADFYVPRIESGEISVQQAVGHMAERLLDSWGDRPSCGPKFQDLVLAARENAQQALEMAAQDRKEVVRHADSDRYIPTERQAMDQLIDGKESD